MKLSKMKQLRLFVLFLSVVIAMTGCSQDELLPNGGKENDVTQGLHEVEVTFNLRANAGVQTRSFSRPINSSDNWQRVSNMRIYVFRSATGGGDETYQYYRPEVKQADGSLKKQDYFYVPDFYKDDNWGDVWGDTEEENECHAYSIKPLLDEDYYYKFLAVGRDDIDEVNYPSLTSLANMKLTDPNLSKDEYPENLVKSLSSEKDNWEFGWSDGIVDPDYITTLDYAYMMSVATPAYKLTEVFSGCSEAWHVTSDSKGFVAPITLKRAVAGLLLYVENIPMKVEATLSLGKETTSGGPGRPPKVSYKIEAGKTYDVSRIAISQLILNKNVMLSSNRLDEEFWNFMSPNKDFIEYPLYIDINGDEFNKKDNDGVCYRGKYFTGCCIAPFPAPSPSMTIKEGQSASFKIPSNVEDLKDGETQAIIDNTLYLVFYHDVKGSTFLYPIKWIPIQMKNGERKFSIDANYFYSVGNRNIEKKIDDPIDLRPGSGGDGGNEIVIEVVPDWQWEGELEWQ